MLGVPGTIRIASRSRGASAQLMRFHAAEKTGAAAWKRVLEPFSANREPKMITLLSGFFSGAISAQPQWEVVKKQILQMAFWRDPFGGM